MLFGEALQAWFHPLLIFVQAKTGKSWSYAPYCWRVVCFGCHQENGGGDFLLTLTFKLIMKKTAKLFVMALLASTTITAYSAAVNVYTCMYHCGGITGSTLEQCKRACGVN